MTDFLVSAAIAVLALMTTPESSQQEELPKGFRLDPDLDVSLEETDGSQKELVALGLTGNSYALVAAAKTYLDPDVGERQNFKTACRLLEQAAEMGNAEGQFLLGQCHYFGVGTPTNYAEAVRCFVAASTNTVGRSTVCGNVGLVWLGKCIAEGYGMPHDLVSAAACYARAAQQERPAEAQVALASCYARGAGVPQDLERAAELYRLAAQSDEIGPRGEANGWLWLKDRQPRWRLTAEEFNAYRPIPCDETLRSCESLKTPLPRFSAGVDVACLYRVPPEGLTLPRLARAFLPPLCVTGAVAQARVRWIAASLTVPDPLEAPDEGEDVPSAVKPPYDLSFEAAFEHPVNMDDVRALVSFGELPAPFKAYGSFHATLKDDGKLLFVASSPDVLAATVARYAAPSEDVLDFPYRDDAFFTVYAPSVGSTILRLFDEEQIRWLGSEIGPDGGDLLVNLGPLFAMAAVTTEDKIRFSATLPAWDDEDVKLLRRPICAIAKKGAASASLAARESPPPMAALLSVLQNLSVTSTNSTVSVDTVLIPPSAPSSPPPVSL